MILMSYDFTSSIYFACISSQNVDVYIFRRGEPTQRVLLGKLFIFILKSP